MQDKGTKAGDDAPVQLKLCGSDETAPAKLSDEEFAALFAHMTDAELAERMGTTRAAVSCKARRMGLRKSPEQRVRAHKLAGRAISGERHYKWKGGITSGEREGDQRYRPWRDAVLARDNYTCTRCGGRRRRSEMHAHHIKPYADFPDDRYILSNGTTLCLICHHALHGRTVRPRIKIPCKCGCGTLIDAVDKWGLAREWVNGGHASRGRVLTQAQRAAVATGNVKRRGRRMSEETKAKMSASKLGQPKPPGFGALMASKTKGRKDSDETRFRKSLGHQGKALSPAHREAIRAGHLRRRGSPTEDS